jgi:hypothetical protein
LLEAQAEGKYDPKVGVPCPITNKINGHTEHDLLSESNRLMFMENIANTWRNVLSGGFAPVDPSMHICSAITEKRIPGEYVSSDEEDELEEPYIRKLRAMTPEARQFKGLPDPPPLPARKRRRLESTGCTMLNLVAKIFKYGETYHMCLNQHCDVPWNEDAHKHFLYAIDNVYVCKETGIQHFCGDYCDRLVMGADKTYVCTLTGRCAEGPTLPDNTNRAAPEMDFMMNTNSNDGGHNNMNPRRRNSFEAKLDMDALQHASENMIIAAGKRRNGFIAHTKKQEMFLYAFSKITNIFSDDQLKLEDELKAKDIQKEIDSQIVRYVNKSSQSKSLLAAHDMFLISINQHKKMDGNIRFKLTEEERKKICLHYARMCIQLWFVVVTRTATGKANPSLFPFKEFVMPALMLMQTGLEIPASDLGYRAVLIQRDDILQARSLTSAARIHNKAKTGSVAEFSGRKRSQSEKIRNGIEHALMSAVVSEKVAPYELDPSSVAYDSIDVDSVRIKL